VQVDQAIGYASPQVFLNQYSEDIDSLKTQIILAREWLKDVTHEQIAYLVDEAIRAGCRDIEPIALRVAKALLP